MLTLIMASVGFGMASNEKCTYDGKDYSHGAEHHGQRCEHGTWR